MKKPYHLILLLISVFILSACEKDAPEIMQPGTYPIGTVVSTGGGSAGGGTTATAAYQPFSKNSYWKYESLYLGQTNSATYTLTGNSTQINGRNYYEVKLDITAFGTQTGYYSYSSGTYYMRAGTIVQGLTVELPYLKDNLNVGGTWTANITDNGKINGVPARIKGKIIAKGGSREVNGKTYTDVIQTSLELQYDMLGTGFETFGNYEFYVAKGIGIIENRSLFNGVEASNLKLVEYSIK